MVGKENGFALARNLESSNLPWPIFFWKLERESA
jgi:hypothetical protein